MDIQGSGEKSATKKKVPPKSKRKREHVKARFGGELQGGVLTENTKQNKR